MSSQISGLQNSLAEEMRMKTYREQLQRQFDSNIHEMEVQHQDEVQKLSEDHAEQLTHLRHAFDVRISAEAEALEEKLQEIQARKDEKIGAEKRRAESEFSQLKQSEQKRIEEYKKRSEEQLETLRNKLQAATTQLHEQARKTAKKEGLAHE